MVSDEEMFSLLNPSWIFARKCLNRSVKDSRHALTNAQFPVGLQSSADHQAKTRTPFHAVRMTDRARQVNEAALLHTALPTRIR